MSSSRARTLGRWLCAGGLLALASTGCRSKSYPLDGGGGGGDPGAEASTCTCSVPNGGVSTSVACGASACGDGTLYLCSGGTPIVIGDCAGASDAGDGSEGGLGGGCMPSCSGRSCGNDDGCGGVCECAAGLPCDPVNGACGNGCRLQTGDPCQPDASASTNPQACCQDGYQCATGDAGYSGCCATTSAGDAGLGTCQMDTDCCDYPSVHCRTNHLCE
jgi:hypothetical protein